MTYRWALDWTNGFIDTLITARNYRQLQRYHYFCTLHFTVHCHMYTTVLSSVVTSWQNRFQHSSYTNLTHEVTFAQPISCLAIIPADSQKTPLPLCCILIHCCRDVFTAQLHSNKRRVIPQRTLLATPLLLLHDITVNVTHSSAVCVWAIT
jgi:hypothetical protein